MTRPFELQGHRGARGLFPENTLEGFRAALALGLESFELDAGVTRDGVVVVHHDPALNPDTTRRPDGAWITEPVLLKDLRLAELAALDVGRIRPGSRYAALYPEQVPADGARIPTLEQVLRFDPRPRVTIELKLLADHPDWTVAPEEMVERVLAAVDAAGATSRVTISSFDWRAQRHVRRLRPGMEVAWLTREETVREAELWWDGASPRQHGGSVPRAVAAEGGPTWSPEHLNLTEADLDAAHRLGLRVVPWTVNRPQDMARLISWGVDGLITDRPDLARPLLSTRAEDRLQNP